MSSVSLSIQWYQPAEILTLKRWLVFSFFINLFIIAVNMAIKSNGDYSLSILVTISFLILKGLMHGKITNSRRVLLLLISLMSVLAAFKIIIDGTYSLYRLWVGGWLLIPALATFIAMLSKPVNDWCHAKFSENEAQKGLNRNNKVLPRFESFGTHTILVHATLTVLIPLVWIFDISISPGNALGGVIGDSFSIEHYNFILTNHSFYLWFKNSVVISAGTVVISLFFAIPAGYAFSRYNFSGRKESMRLFMVIQMFPGVIILVPYFMVMKTLGLLNSSIGLIIIYSVSALPISVWMLKGYFDTIPRELEEAAMLDGCNQLQVFYRVILPLSITAISVTALIAFLAAWNEFLLALVFNTASDMFTLPVGLVSLIPATGQRWGDFAAASIIVSTPIAILFIYFQKSLITGLSSGSVKG